MHSNQSNRSWKLPFFNTDNQYTMLTETEQNYSTIERGTLRVVLRLETFHYFTYGKHCTLCTDHKLLESIFRKKFVHCPTILQRLLIRPLKYDATGKYVKGSEVPITDSRSRVTPQPCMKADQSHQAYVHQYHKDTPSIAYQTTPNKRRNSKG